VPKIYDYSVRGFLNGNDIGGLAVIIVIDNEACYA
jgi:hypothetical protein